jgi:hypothetical protein
MPLLTPKKRKHLTPFICFEAGVSVLFYRKQRCYTQPSLMSFVLFACVCFRAGHIAIYLQFSPWLLAPGTCGRYNLSKLLCEYACVLMYHMLFSDLFLT